MDKNKLTIRILIALVVILSLAVLYAFVLRPAFSGFVTNQQIGAYNQGYMQAWSDIYSQWAQNGNVQIPVGEEQVLVLGGQLVQVSPQ